MYARIYLPIVILVAAMGCSHDVAGPDSANEDLFKMRFGGALQADFESIDGIARNVARIATIREQQYLDLFFGIVKRSPEKEQEGITRVSIPFDSENGFPEAGVITFPETEQAHFQGLSSFFLTLNDDSQLRAVYDFRATALRLRITESSNERIKGFLNLAARQTRGLRNSHGQIEEVQLANDGQVGVAVEFDVKITDF